MPKQSLQEQKQEVTWIPTDDLDALFKLCNSRYFDDALAPSPGFKLTFSRSVRLSGCFTYCLETHQDWGIQISRRLQDHPLAMLSTMVHEMIHMLAHQRFRETGDRQLLDETPEDGQPFVNPGHGAFFLHQLEQLNRGFPELGITVKSTFGDALYDHSKIAPVRLLVVFIDRLHDKGMVYQLHPKAPLQWERLRRTAIQVHGVSDFTVLEVAGHLAEGFPTLRRDNAPRVNMRTLSLRQFGAKVAGLLTAPESVVLPDYGSIRHSFRNTSSNCLPRPWSSRLQTPAH